MKLLYCPKCGDIIRLIRRSWRECECGEIRGRYTTELLAEYQGEAIPLAIDNISFKEALKNQPEEGLGFRFESFVIPKKCSTIKRKRKKYKKYL